MLVRNITITSLRTPSIAFDLIPDEKFADHSSNAPRTVYQLMRNRLRSLHSPSTLPTLLHSLPLIPRPPAQMPGDVTDAAPRPKEGVRAGIASEPTNKQATGDLKSQATCLHCHQGQTHRRIFGEEAPPGRQANKT
jgi:hypothetical protein